MKDVKRIQVVGISISILVMFLILAKVILNLNINIVKESSDNKIFLDKQKAVGAIDFFDIKNNRITDPKVNNRITINVLKPPNNLKPLPQDGITDCTLYLQDIVNYIRENYNGGTIYIPPIENGYLIKQGEISLCDNITIWGNETKIKSNNDDNINNIFVIYEKNNIYIYGLDFYSDDTPSNTIAIHIMNGSKNIIVERIRCDNLRYFVKIDSNNVSKVLSDNVVVNRCKTTGTLEPIYTSSVINVLVNDCTFDRTGDTNNLNHHLYINSYTLNIIISNCILVGGNGFAIQIKNDTMEVEGAPKANISSIEIKGVSSFIVSEHSSNVEVENVFGYLDNTLEPKYSYFCGVYSNSKLQINNFKISGGDFLLSAIGNLSGGALYLNNGVVGQLSTAFASCDSLKYAKLNNVEFLEVVSSDDKIGIWNYEGANISLLEFYNCIFNIGTTASNDTFSHRLNSTKYFNCEFNITSDLYEGFLFSSQIGGESLFKECKITGDYDNFRYQHSSGKDRIINCYNVMRDFIFSE